MTISQEQARLIAESVAFDIKKYIEEHHLEYEEWKNKQERKEVNDCDNKGTTKTTTTMDKLELCNN